MSPGGADAYNVDIRIVRGHNPDLVVGSERIDLTQYESEEALHALMRSKGFVARMTNDRQNNNPMCYAWRNLGECVRNPSFMNRECALACHQLEDKSLDCPRWGYAECDRNPSFMHVECPVTCGWKKEL